MMHSGVRPSGYFPQHCTRYREAAATMGQASDRIDVPDRYELFILDEEKGEKKVTYVLDTRVPNTAIFTFNKEDHTLGNLLAERLHTYSYVHFSAYKVPHPLFATFELRVSTDGTLSPKEAVVRACRDIVADLTTLKARFTKEMQLATIVVKN
ncbi:hypothetical protein FKW77_007002 [Venturia effusa]|uniref:DNA-directed RNA polymerase RBP11-like dimerisation domain-containing protein n=1 Tax=Venturia effusa TaxID=50376 RepID=A0A517LB31_9PEZI|nr:hypothetical protein FKW77_007002 [Venturia effusa]